MSLTRQTMAMYLRCSAVLPMLIQVKTQGNTLPFLDAICSVQGLKENRNTIIDFPIYCHLNHLVSDHHQIIILHVKCIYIAQTLVSRNIVWHASALNERSVPREQQFINQKSKRCDPSILTR